MTRRSSPIGLVKLHRIHAGAQATRVQFDSLAQTWRGEGGDPAVKEAVAFRLALAWNVLEGVPTKALTEGWLRDICIEVREGNLAAAQALVAQMDAEIDREHGRLHDCAACIGTDCDDEGEAA